MRYTLEIGIKKMTYLEQCNKYFAPLDEICEALRNEEGICGMSNRELVKKVVLDKSLTSDLNIYEGLVISLADSGVLMLDVSESV